MANARGQCLEEEDVLNWAMEGGEDGGTDGEDCGETGGEYIGPT